MLHDRAELLDAFTKTLEGLLQPAFDDRFRFTRQESCVALLLALRHSNREIAEALGISLHTARHHTESVLSKLGVHSRREVSAALARGGSDSNRVSAG